jgi:hypothetical protein
MGVSLPENLNDHVMTFSESANRVFLEATTAYHLTDYVDATMPSVYPMGPIEADLYRKNWIDAVQWHLEDIIRMHLY